MKPKTAQDAAEEFFQLPIGKTILFYKLIQKALEERLPENLSITQGKTICILSAHGPMNQRQLGEHLSLEPATVARALDNLEQQGLVKREAFPGDRRAFLVHLTRSGAAKFPGLHQTILTVNQLALEGLSAKEIAQLSALLDKLNLNLMNHVENPPTLPTLPVIPQGGAR